MISQKIYFSRKMDQILNEKAILDYAIESFMVTIPAIQTETEN